MLEFVGPSLANFVGWILSIYKAKIMNFDPFLFLFGISTYIAPKIFKTQKVSTIALNHTCGLVNLIDKLSDGWIRNLEFNPCLHQKPIDILV